MTYNWVDVVEGQVADEAAVNALGAAVEAHDAALEPVAGTVLRPHLYAYLPSDHALDTLSTAFQDVPGIASPVLPGTYLWELYQIYICATSDVPDIKAAFTLPTLTSSSYSHWHLATAASGAGPYSLLPTRGTLANDVAFFTAGALGLGVPVLSKGHMTFSAAGTVQLRAAQNTSNANVVTVGAGTQLKLVKIA